MDPKLANEVSISDLFDQFIDASTMRNVLSIHHRILNYSDLNPCEFNVFFPKLKRAVLTNRTRKNWRAKALFSKIDKKAALRCYSNTKANLSATNRADESQRVNSQECLDDSVASLSNQIYCNNNALQHYNCLIIGSGPAGLRTAIELQLLGASRVVVVEKRGRFSRNNVLHLWPFVIDDLKSLGAKKFYGKFCAGSIDHIPIRQLQLILLKICLMIGCDLRDSCSYLCLCPDSIKQSQQIINGNNSDSTKANGSGDDIESIKLTCDLDKTKLPDDDGFVQVTFSDIERDENSDAIDRGLDEQVVKDKIDEQAIVVEKSSDISLEGGDSPKKDTVDCPVIKTPLQTNVQVRRSGENLRGARAHFKSEHNSQDRELHSYEWDIIIGADGRLNTLTKFFPHKEFRGRLAIAITANFINRQTPAEASVSEISGLSFIYNQDMFNALAYDTNIQLENICYYKDDTHYFVMTAKKKSLLERGVLIQDYATTQDLLSESNIDRQALLTYAKDAAFWTTGLEPLDFALNHYGQEDCAMFDFTSMYAASNACKALRTKAGGLTLVGLVGDSLLEPFWPTGSGCARGFLSSFDAAWMCRQWAVNKCAVIDHHNSISSRSSRNRSSLAHDSNLSGSLEPTTYNRMALSVMAERESIYRILAQTTSENLQQNYSKWTLNPHSRYPNLNRHLVTPSQVEHLITDSNQTKLSPPERGKSGSGVSDRARRVKSPNNSSSRKSPKKLKSAGASPLMQAKNYKGRARSLTKQRGADKEFRGSYDKTFDETFLELEQSYLDAQDLYNPSISGTFPSSNNLLSLEARRARDIDECLRQRRLRTQLSVVRDQLIGQFKNDYSRRDSVDSSANAKSGGAVLLNELRRLREQQIRGKENNPKEVNGPLTLLNSIRRCTSFAERVKSFESRVSSSSVQESAATTPKSPTDNVKNLKSFATLQELLANNNSASNEPARKSKMPIAKLSKDDWNVKCWEKRLAAYKQKSAREVGGSSKSLNKALSVDSYHKLPPGRVEKHEEIFKDRIKEMAEKLQLAKENNQELYGGQMKSSKGSTEMGSNLDSRSKGWVSHLKRELTKRSGPVRPQDQVRRQAMNPAVPHKPIKKLFDDEDNDGNDINSHCDHLCINRPTNRYLPKNGYTSHLRRTKFNSATARIINNHSPSVESKQAYLATLKGSSLTSNNLATRRETQLTGVSAFGDQQQSRLVEKTCLRCKSSVSVSDGIMIGESTLHRTCLTCANCGITLRTNEIEHYLAQMANEVLDENENTSFACAICKPEIRAELSKEAAERLESAQLNGREAGEIDNITQRRLRSREEFLNERINYNELYKNIIDNNGSSEAANKIERLGSRSEPETITSKTSAAASDKSLVTESIRDDRTIDVVLAVSEGQASKSTIASSSRAEGYRIVRSETVDGDEQVTLVLPATTTPISPTRAMIDEEELHRILHLDRSTVSSSNDKNDRSLPGKSGEAESEGGTDEDESSGESDDDDDDDERAEGELSDDPSSLNSPLQTGDYDDVDDADPNSTYEDFLTSEEFGAASEEEDSSQRSQLADDSNNASDPDEPDRDNRVAQLATGEAK